MLGGKDGSLWRRIVGRHGEVVRYDDAKQEKTIFAADGDPVGRPA
jgi:hypothetical protein